MWSGGNNSVVRRAISAVVTADTGVEEKYQVKRRASAEALK